MTILLLLNVDTKDKQRSHAYDSDCGAFFSVVAATVTMKCVCVCIFYPSKFNVIVCTISVFFLPERTFHGQIEILPNFNIFTTLIRYQPWHIQFKGKKNENYIKKMSINVHGQRSK